MGKKKIGKIHPPESMFLRKNVGTAKADDGTVYELTTTFSDGSPIVNSDKTGKYFTLSWTDIINLAVDAGLDKP